MPQPKNAMEIFRLLDQSNCRQCGKKTCLAFAGAVLTRQKKLSDCPRLDEDTLGAFGDDPRPGPGRESDGEHFMRALINEVTGLDLKTAAERVGGRFLRNRLTLNVLGKDVTIDRNGRFYTDIHVNVWMVVPLLVYVLHGQGAAVSGKWVPFRELSGGRERAPLFGKRCETVIKDLADHYPGLFRDIVTIFNGRQVARQFASDISVVLHPLPKVPIMMCYWMPEDGMASSFNLFYDESANRNLDIDAAFTLGTGLAAMFEKLAVRHGFSSGAG